ncbi:MAG: Hsp20/alpha crystallin family protein [Rickettsiales bacterium]
MGKVFSIMPWRDLSTTGDDTGWHSLQRLQRDVDTIFDRILQGSVTGRSSEVQGFAPRLDIAESSEAYHLTAELPGVSEKDIDLQINDGVLTLKGEKKSEVKQEDKNYHRIERHYGSFQRSIALPAEVDEASIKARFQNGVLEIDLPKAKDQKPKSKKIEIASS